MLSSDQLTSSPSFLCYNKRILLCTLAAMSVWCKASLAYFPLGAQQTSCVEVKGEAVSCMQACCTEAGMFALRERRVHVTQVRASVTRSLQHRHRHGVLPSNASS